jgi:hypothetical protein
MLDKNHAKGNLPGNARRGHRARVAGKAVERRSHGKVFVVALPPPALELSD